jgi:hypothetical protein
MEVPRSNLAVSLNFSTLSGTVLNGIAIFAFSTFSGFKGHDELAF